MSTLKYFMEVTIKESYSCNHWNEARAVNLQKMKPRKGVNHKNHMLSIFSLSLFEGDKRITSSGLRE